MKQIFLALAFISTLIIACSDDDEQRGCYQFLYAKKFRSPDAEWEKSLDTICYITEMEAEKHRAEHDINNSDWIINCTKKLITAPHTHKK